jgi:hypothetical protein
MAFTCFCAMGKHMTWIWILSAHVLFDLHMMAPTRLEGIGFMISRDPLSSSATASTTRYGRDTPRLCRTVSHLEGTDSRTMRITPALFLVSILLSSNRG